ncbi:efflux RND transporter periplasmic adaptor subunit [Novosphingobium mangrovi (ex Huang et al. 2023)]|uniref:Efflux RND transporter periplasmic adaptor subunit n=1 Tax=Novosphingobium mangrovi (ex Huang et al. 2023) TaxID=2976432 RepID=A0ABT2I9X6_9SPHN|nr:efflux RND transporter periplasmic adaptor subunit [Novosphingobium mangrovi (ex Huang et al. 2023)]MCT2401368.1 efflux RND transporter periplasmic adaptor subunit [Novosphingobium mangrovi (ex Huang et al. 2023)]
MDRKLLAGGTAALLAVAAFGYYAFAPSPTPDQGQEAPATDPGVLSPEQVSKLGIRLEPAQAADAVPLGTVPGQVSLPPSARVAVTTPFAGTAVRVLVLEGEQVRQGQPLAVVRAAEPVQFGADLARAQADLALDRANAQRLDTLAREGIVAGARADAARAALRRSEATVAENRRLLSLAGAGQDGTVTLRAPITGRIARVSIETGGPVGGEMAPFVVENTAALTLDLQVPGHLAGKVRPGMQVSVPISGSDGAMATGKLLSVGASLDPQTRSIAAKASLDAAPGIIPGQGVMAIISGDAEQAGRTGFSVPSAAVTRIDGQDYVFVKESGPKGEQRFARRKVDVVANAGGRAIIAEGLKKGEPVAVSGIAELKSVLAGQ